MEALIALVPLLVCPILMGLIAWMMVQQPTEQVQFPHAKISLWHDLKRMMLSCFNPKLIAIAAIVGLGLYLYGPTVFFRYAPWLLVIICPASMLLTMWTLYRQNGLPKTKLTKEDKNI